METGREGLDERLRRCGKVGEIGDDWGVLRRLLPYLWRYRWRVAVALLFMVAAKLATVGVPLLLKELVDALTAEEQAAKLAAVEGE